MKVTLALLAVLAVAGCSDTPEPKPPPPVAAPLPPAPKNTDIVIEVNGKALTRGEVEEELNFRLDSARSRVQPQFLPNVRAQIINGIIDRFIAQTLLLEAANKEKIAVTEADTLEAYEMIKKQLPPGMTLEQAIQTSPRGGAAMREEVENGIRINKFLAARMKDTAKISDEEIAAFTKRHEKQIAAVPATAHARHILIAISGDDSDDAKAEKKKKAESIQKKLAGGADFAALAKEHSACPSKQKGGDLGTFPRGQMVKEFEDAAFSQPVNTIGDVVETKYGFHIIEVLDRTEKGVVPHEEIVAVLRQEKERTLFTQVLQELRSRARIVNNVDKAFPPEAADAMPSMPPMMPMPLPMPER